MLVVVSGGGSESGWLEAACLLACEVLSRLRHPSLVSHSMHFLLCEQIMIITAY